MRKRRDSRLYIFMHVGANDLNSENNTEKVAKSIVDLVKGMVSEKRKVAISGIITKMLKK